MLCDGVEDRYRAHARPGEGLLVVLRHHPGEGDLSLEIRKPEVELPPLSRSDTLHGVEVVGVQAAPDPQDLDIVVKGRAGFHVGYSLTLRRHPAEGCIPDPFERLLGNDDAQHATRTGLGDHEIVLCQGDEDWFALQMPAGSRLDLQASGEESLDHVALTVMAPGQELLAQGEQEGDSLLASADVVIPGRYLVRLRSLRPDVRIPLRLRMEAVAVEEAETLACEHGVDLVPGILTAIQPTVAVDRFTLSCSLPLNADYVASFELPQPGLVSARVTGATSMAIRGDCDERASELACVLGRGAVIEDLLLDAGRWYLVWEASGLTLTQVLVTVRGLCEQDANCDASDRCDGGVCHLACREDDDCEGAQICTAGSGHCREPERCESPRDCAGLRVCRYDGQCFLPLCEENADCGEGVCIDRSCAQGPRVSCRDDGDCPGPQVCTELGLCVLAQPCIQDEDCPEGAGICDLARGSCVVCTTGGHCDFAELCEEGRCIYQGFCTDGGQCPGDRVCGPNWSCLPPEGCPGDRFDGLADPPLLVARTYGGLLLCDGSEDRYVTTVPAQTGLQVVLRHCPADGDLSLVLRKPLPVPEELARSDQPLGMEVVELDAAPEERTFDIVIQGRPGFSVPYSLSLERRGAEACAADGFEGLLGNDEPDHASPIGPGTYELSLCSGDEDWFALQIAAGTRLRARGLPSSPNTLVDLALLASEEQEPLAEGQEEGEGEERFVTLSEDITQPGRYFLRLRPGQGPDSGGNVVLEIDAQAAANAETLACAHPLPLVAGEAITLPMTLPVALFNLSCAEGLPESTVDHLASFSLAQESVVSLRSGEGSRIALRSVCDDPDSEQLCTRAMDPALQEVSLAAGTWFVLVRGGADRHDMELLLTSL